MLEFRDRSERIGNELNFDSSFSLIRVEGVFETEDFLKHCASKLVERESLETKELWILHKIQKKFEVFGRVFKSYNSSLRRVSDLIISNNTYLILAFLLLKLFENQGNFNHINTAIKILDKLAAEISLEIMDKSLAIRVFRLEATLLDND